MADSKKKAKKKTASQKSEEVEKKQTKNKTASKKSAAKKSAPKKTSAKKKSAAKKTTQKKSNVKKKPAAKKTTEKSNVSYKKKDKFKLGDSTQLEEIIEDANNPEVIEEEIDPAAKKRGDIPMTLVGHLDEMRTRLLIIMVLLLLLTMTGFYFADYILEIINKPFTNTGHKLHIFKMMGGFVIKIKAAFVASVIISIPLLLFEVWRFIKPAIGVKDRMFSRLSLIFGALLFYGGASFVFFLILPFAVPILLNFIPTAQYTATIDANDYLNTLLLLSFMMGLLFELPIIAMILTRIGVLTPLFLIKKRKFGVVLSFIIGAVLTPQDPLSMFAVALPLIILYEISIIISKIVVKRRKKQELAERRKVYEKKN